MRYESKIIPHEIIIKKTLVDFFSEFNHIKIVKTAKRGKILILDDEIQFAEYDEYVYHEMFCFPALFSHLNPERVLVIGGGDLLLARQILKHPGIESVTIIELDAYVTKFCLKHFRSLIGGVIKDPRLRIEHKDGNVFLQENQNLYDLIYVDLPDEKRNCKFVLEEKFYHNLKRSINSNGIICAQTGNIDKIYFSLHSRKARKKYFNNDSNYVLNYYHFFEKYFKSVILFHEHVPSFFGSWSFILSSKDRDLKSINREQLNNYYNLINKDTLYYSPDYHESIFFQPKILQPTNQSKIMI
ncbi:MAG: hypothetical protein ACFE96_14600 [Candidatus Hermodarchaeota archaeon]